MAENSATIVSASEIEISFGQQNILDKASLSIREGDRIGMVGRNGTGKSTFLKILAGIAQPDAGQVVRSKELTLGYLSQEFTLDESKNVFENVLSGGHYVLDLIHEFENLPLHSKRHDHLEHRIAHLEGWTLDSRVKETMSHLNTPAGDRDIKTLSGGEKRRVAMAKALVSHPDLLILDEPTNHLDPESIEWVVNFLLGYTGAFLVVTHDRYFLDRITTSIVEVANGKMFSYEGNYTEYLLAKAERETAQERQEQSRQNFLRRELDWVRRGPKARTTKSKSRLDRYFEVEGKGPPPKEMAVDLVIPPPPPLGNRVVDLENVGITLGERKLFEKLSLKFEAGSKVGVAGRNGLGKSTLLKIILGQLKPTEGTVKIGDLTKFNYVDQSRLQLDESKTVYEELGQGSEVVQFGDDKISVRAYLRRFLFPEDRIMAQVKYLSGGERSRLLLARILKNGGNFLILDEPTNDLDLPTLRILEEALINFPGSVLVVSHDRYFLDRVCTSMIVFEGDGQITESVGNYEYYLEKKRAAELHSAEAGKVAPVIESKTQNCRVQLGSTFENPSKPRKLKFKEQQELAGMETAIHEAEAEVARLEAEISSPDFYKRHEEHTQIKDALHAAREKVSALYARWEELESLKT